MEFLFENPADIVEKIKSHLSNGGSVMICSYTRPLIYGPKCIEMFRNGPKSGDPQMLERRQWINIKRTTIKFI